MESFARMKKNNAAGSNKLCDFIKTTPMINMHNCKAGQRVDQGIPKSGLFVAFDSRCAAYSYQ
jgi:hypothetical protein